MWNQSLARAGRKEVWSTGLLVLSSAALGGIAVALWNRQSLAKIRSTDVENHIHPDPEERFEDE